MHSPRCTGYFHANMSRAQCLQYPHSTGWNSSINPALSKCQTRRAMKRYSKRFTGLCYNEPGCTKGRINLPHYQPWPPELCHERGGLQVSYKLKTGRTESCLTRDQLAGLMSNSGEVSGILVSDVVVWGNCYLPEPPNFTVGEDPSQEAPPPYAYIAQ
jgi:hypothetical protein